MATGSAREWCRRCSAGGFSKLAVVTRPLVFVLSSDEIGDSVGCCCTHGKQTSLLWDDRGVALGHRKTSVLRRNLFIPALIYRGCMGFGGAARRSGGRGCSSIWIIWL